MRVALVQTDIVWEQPEQNFQRVAPKVEAAALAGARLVVLPEMFACGFSMNTAGISEGPGGRTASFLSELAARHQVWVGGSLPELSAPSSDERSQRPTNTFVLASPGGELVRYQKIHPFSFANEHLYYRAGNEFVQVTVDGVRLCLFVCYDLRFANEFWVNAPSTDCYVVIANWPARRREHWKVLLRARAIENQAYVVGVNRVGLGGSEQGASQIEYVGDSCVIDPSGEVLCSAAGDEATLLAEISAERVHSVRQSFPVLQDRREIS